jgi:soluble cytochrome b562
LNTEDSEFDKLCKVLALTNSDKSGEALAAFQSAKRMLLRHGLSIEDIVAAYFDKTGMPPQQKIETLQKQNTSLQRDLKEQARELKDHKTAMDDLLKQIWDLQEGELAPVSKEEASTETIKEVYHPNIAF